ncbi:MAG: hypothetical protein ABIJ96_05125 [Elusimicrobiota bacterium]
MKRICAWCRNEMPSAGAEQDSSAMVTHGICAACEARLFPQDAISLQQALEKMDVPILLLESDVVTVTGNRRARELLGRTLSEIRGVKGGELIRCVNSAGPGGCGRSEHCAGCVIRETVQTTYATGRPFFGLVVEKDVETPAGVKSLKLRISTQKIGPAVFLSIDEAG